MSSSFDDDYFEEVIHEGDGYQLGKNKYRGLIELQPTTWGVDAALPSHFLGVCTQHKVQSLDLSYTGIRELPEGLTRCRDLKRLDLRGNGLDEIPSTVHKLTTLTHLDLLNNRLERVTGDIGHLLDLEELNIGGNPSLAHLPPTLGHSLKKLRRLWCDGTGLAWEPEELYLSGFQLRELQLLEHGAQALPTHQTGELAIDSLVIYCDQDREMITTEGFFGDLSLCGQLEDQGHSLTPVSDLDSIRLGLQHCKAVVVCISSSFSPLLLSEVLQCQRPIVAVTLGHHALPPALKKQLFGLKAQGNLLEYQEDNREVLDILSKKLTQLIKVYYSSTHSAILLRGPAAVKVFNEASTDGVGCDTRFRVIVIGQERSGKTSLVKLLTGREFNPNEKVTHVIDIFNTKALDEIWKIYNTQKDGRNYNEQEILLARDIANKIKESGKIQDIQIKDDATLQDFLNRCNQRGIRVDIEKKTKGNPGIPTPDYSQKVVASKENKAPGQKKSPILTDAEKSSTSSSSLTNVSSSPLDVTNSPQQKTPAVLTDDAKGSSTSSPSLTNVSSSPLDVTNSSIDTAASLQPDALVSKELMKLVKEMVAKDNLEGSSGKLQLEISIWDFGGQYFYYTTHQVFLSSAAIFIVVFNLTKKMSDPATDWREDGFTNGQVLEFWLNSIYAYTKGSEALSVLLVGTHAADVSQQQINEVLEYIANLLEKKCFCEMIMQDKCLSGIFYAIENSLSFTNNPEAQRLKSDIEEKVIPELMKNRQKRPLSWLNFEKRLRTAKKGHNQDFYTIEEVKDMAVECKVIKNADDEDTLLTILQFLHDIGVVLYYGKDDPALRDLVILNPEWLLDIFKKLIIVPKPKHKTGKLIKAWKKLEESHILENVLADFVLGGKLRDHKASIVHIMKKFDLFCERVRQHQVSYYVPFVLVENEQDELLVNRRTPYILKPGSDTIFQFDFNGFLPGGLFHRLVVRLLGWSEHTSKETAVNMPEPKIYYRYVAANININHVVSLEWMKQSQIKVVVKRYSGPNTFPESSIFQQVLDFLKKTLLELQTMGMRQVEYDLFIHLRDYPGCEHTECEVSHLCRLQLQHCLDSPTPIAFCPIHPTSRVYIDSILPRFKVMPGPSPTPIATALNQPHPPAQAGTPPQSTSPWQPQPPYRHQSEAPHPPPPSHHGATGSTTATHGQATPSRPDTDLSDVFLLGLSKDLGAKWMEMGIYLGMRQPDIDRAKANHQFDMTTQAHSLLIQWRIQTGGNQNKRELLATALGQAGCIEIAEKHGLAGPPVNIETEGIY